ncbi:MAG TPA: lipoyl synthase [bacterium]|nr:lipoyl synthase [bacterium]HNS48744.1 lipoyl synthase [bacterium]
MEKRPAWLTKRLVFDPAVQETEAVVARHRLHTVCAAAGCPNRSECFARRVATFMILGDVCTRGCAFCGVRRGRPEPPAADEPDRVAAAAAALGLEYVVVTSVTRDDLPDGGAGLFARTVTAIRAARPPVRVEVLTPDFQGDRAALETVLSAGPAVFNHNLETVARLYPRVRPQAGYRRSLEVLRRARRFGSGLVKSGLMLGLGETDAEVESALADLREAGVEIVTLGQYLRPNPGCLPVTRHPRPEEFDAWAETAKRLGFRAAAAGPFVRSSYYAAEVFRSTGT